MDAMVKTRCIFLIYHGFIWRDSVIYLESEFVFLEVQPRFPRLQQTQRHQVPRDHDFPTTYYISGFDWEYSFNIRAIYVMYKMKNKTPPE